MRPVEFRDGKLIVLDQTLLPAEEKYIVLDNKESVRDAIARLVVRGAPAIGVAAAYGLYVSVRDIPALSAEEFIAITKNVAEYINAARPTAVNLSWALKRMVSAVEAAAEKLPKAGVSSGVGVELCSPVTSLKMVLNKEADAICKEDMDANLAMGRCGLTLLKPGMGVLTHCNAGALATSAYGTCLAPIYLGHEQGYGFRMYADETRPLLQGARLTSWELKRAGIDVTVICDNMANTVMKQGLIDAVVVGCDRMAANGDGANKIGTSGVAVLAKEHGIPFYMFVPTSTIDLDTKTGADIVIEERDPAEIGSMWYEKPMVPAGVKAYNPAFDVTDAEYITAVVTEKGIAYPPYSESLPKLVGRTNEL